MAIEFLTQSSFGAREVLPHRQLADDSLTADLLRSNYQKCHQEIAEKNQPEKSVRDELKLSQNHGRHKLESSKHSKLEFSHARNAEANKDYDKVRDKEQRVLAHADVSQKQALEQPEKNEEKGLFASQNDDQQQQQDTSTCLMAALVGQASVSASSVTAQASRAQAGEMLSGITPISAKLNSQMATVANAAEALGKLDAMPTTASDTTSSLSAGRFSLAGMANSSPADVLASQDLTTLLNNAHKHLTGQNSLQAQLDAMSGIDAVAGSRTSQTSQWGPLPLTPSASVSQHAKEMLTPLREQLKFQFDQRIQKADLRLDPPELGKVELNIRLDGDRLHIQMHAANNHIRDALQSGLERLRAELAQDHGGDIQLDVAAQDQHSGQGDGFNHDRSNKSRDIALGQMIHETSSTTEAEPLSTHDVNLLA